LQLFRRRAQCRQAGLNRSFARILDTVRVLPFLFGKLAATKVDGVYRASHARVVGGCSVVRITEEDGAGSNAWPFDFNSRTSAAN
jgi:hypothetical protein